MLAYIKLDSTLVAQNTAGANARELVIIGKTGNGPGNTGCDAGGSALCASWSAMRLSYVSSKFSWRSCSTAVTGGSGGGNVPVANAWYAITAGIDSSGQAQLFVNGIFMGSFSNPSFSPSGGNFITFGLSNGGAQPFYMDEFRFYSTWDDSLKMGWQNSLPHSLNLEYYLDFSPTSDGASFIDRSGHGRDVLITSDMAAVLPSPACAPFENGTSRR